MPAATAVLMRVEVVPPDKEHPTLRIDYAVSPRDIRFEATPEKGRKATVDFMATVWDAQSRFVTSNTQAIDVNIKPDANAEQLRAGIPAHQELALKPGKYTVCLGAMDRATQKVGTVWLETVVPEDVAVAQPKTEGAK
jgi:hypothetical protein